MPYEPIDCSLYDYLELACMHRYEINLSLVGGAASSGVATDTETNNGAEFLIIKSDNAIERVRLDLISSLQVVTEPRVFDYVDFKSA